MAEVMKRAASEFVFEKITDRKLNGDNFLPWKRVIEIHVIARAKDHHLTDDPRF